MKGQQKSFIFSRHSILMVVFLSCVMFGIYVFAPTVESHPDANVDSLNNPRNIKRFRDSEILPKEVPSLEMLVPQQGSLPVKVLSNGIKMPLLLYGTAWKEEKTKQLTLLALETGFRGIDTANQGRHYNEIGVGEALSIAIQKGIVARNEVFIQTKFTFARGHSEGQAPYDINAPYTDQVKQSFESSLKHLQIDYIDSYIIHGPYQHGTKISSFDLEVYHVLEELYKQGKVRAIGISNFSAKQLELLLKQVNIIPHVAQIRTFANKNWDDKIGGVYSICKENNIIFEAYSLLTANRYVLKHPKFKQIAKDHHKSVQQIAFKFAFQEGMVVLTGTTDKVHMEQDLAIEQSMSSSFLMSNLDVEERNLIRQLGTG